MSSYEQQRGNQDQRAILEKRNEYLRNQLANTLDMDFILIGAEYSETTTLAVKIAEWANKTLGGQHGFHDHLIGTFQNWCQEF